MIDLGDHTTKTDDPTPMLLSRIRSLQAKLLTLVLLSCVLTTVLVGSVLLYRDVAGTKSRTIDRLATIARVHAINLDAALHFDSVEEAAEMLESLAIVDDLGAARVYNNAGELFADFRRRDDAPPMPPQAPAGDFEANEWYYVVEPITFEDHRIGTLVIAYDLHQITAQRNFDAMISSLVGLLASALALLLALRLLRSVTGPIAELLTTARRVAATQDYSVRAKKHEDDELGQFTDVFNEMLQQVDRHSETVRQANARFRTVVEASPNGVVMMDSDGRIMLVNAQTEKLFGYSREELLGRSVEVLVPDRLRGQSQFRDAFFAGPEAQPIGAGRELLGLRKDGTEFPIEIGLNPIGTDEGQRVLGSIVDITKRKAAEQAVRESEQRLRTLMNAIPAIIWTADARGSATSFNKQWFEYTGLDEAASLSGLRPRALAGSSQMDAENESRPSTRGWTNAVHEDDRQRIAERWEQSVQDEVDFECEVRFRRHDGAYRWFLVRALPLHDEHGTVTGWFGTTTDIEDRKLAEQQRDELLASERAARSEAERASRAKDEFVATLSHELRTPLTAILGWAQMLRSGTLPKDQYDHGFEIIHRNARVQTQLIEDLLDMSRIMSGKIRLDVQQVHLPNVIDAAIETVQPGADAKEIRIETNIDSTSAPIRGDADRLQQVIWNLLSNAIKFTPHGGKVQVALQRVNSHLEIAVSDTGDGIEPEFLPYIFERFRQADPSTTRRHGGLGLGLAIVKQLVELHGGAISAASPGVSQGATFTIRLPIAASRSGGTGGLPQSNIVEVRSELGATVTGNNDNGRFTPAATASLAGINVLVVEDEPDARDLIARVLGSRGAHVEAAGSGSEGLERARAIRPDVVVSDIGMPGMDGYEFIRQLRAQPLEAGGRAPAVALTAFARTEDRTRSLLAGYQMHVAKPVDPAVLIASVASLVELGQRPE